MSRKNTIELMQESSLVFYVAMGTMIYFRGVFINRCFDELCLTNPKRIAETAREIIETISDSVAGIQVSAPFGKVELAIDVLV